MTVIDEWPQQFRRNLEKNEESIRRFRNWRVWCKTSPECFIEIKDRKHYWVFNLVYIRQAIDTMTRWKK